MFFLFNSLFSAHEPRLGEGFPAAEHVQLEVTHHIQNLNEIRGVRPFLDSDGYLHVTPNNCQLLVQLLGFYETFFAKYSGGVHIEEWTAEASLDSLKELLLGFNNLKQIKISGSLNNAISIVPDCLKFYSVLEQFDINACGFDEQHIARILSNLLSTELRTINLTGNRVGQRLITEFKRNFARVNIAGEFQQDTDDPVMENLYPLQARDKEILSMLRKQSLIKSLYQQLLTVIRLLGIAPDSASLRGIIQQMRESGLNETTVQTTGLKQQFKNLFFNGVAPQVFSAGNLIAIAAAQIVYGTKSDRTNDPRFFNSERLVSIYTLSPLVFERLIDDEHRLQISVYSVFDGMLENLPNLPYSQEEDRKASEKKTCKDGATRLIGELRAALQRPTSPPDSAPVIVTDERFEDKVARALPLMSFSVPWSTLNDAEKNEHIMALKSCVFDNEIRFAAPAAKIMAALDLLNPGPRAAAV